MAPSRFGSGYTALVAEHQALISGRLTPRDGTRVGVVANHGRGNGPATVVDGASSQVDKTIDMCSHALANAGFIIVHPDNWQLGHFTADPALSRVMDAKNWLQLPTGGGAKAGQAVIRGYSQGGGMSIYAVLQQRALWSCALVSNPMISIKDIHDNNKGGYAAEIETAFGGAAAYAAAADAHDGLTRAAELQGFPMQVHYCDNDPIIDPTLVLQFCSLSGAEAVNMGSHGHTDFYMDCERATAFVKAHT